MDEEKGLDEHRRSALQRVERYSGNRYLWNRTSLPDVRYRERLTIQEIREHCSAMAAVKGRHWHAKMLLESRRFPNRRAAGDAAHPDLPEAATRKPRSDHQDQEHSCLSQTHASALELNSPQFART